MFVEYKTGIVVARWVWKEQGFWKGKSRPQKKLVVIATVLYRHS